MVKPHFDEKANTTVARLHSDDAVLSQNLTSQVSRFCDTDHVIDDYELLWVCFINGLL